MDVEEPWIKTVNKRAMLIPTIALVKASLEAHTSPEGADVPAIRRELAEQFGAYSTCPVTVRRHLKVLGIPASKKAK
jgi:hypothetical protein